MRAKFIVTHTDITLEAVIDGSEENKKFFEATPYALLDMSVVSPDIIAQFKEGMEVYVDFIPVEDN